MTVIVDNKKEAAQPPEFHVVVNLYSGNINFTDSKSCCKLILSNILFCLFNILLYIFERL